VTPATTAKRRFANSAPDTAGPSTQPPPASGIAYLADPIIVEFVFGMMIALVYRAGGRLSMWATMSLIIVGIIWLAVTSPSLPRPYSAGVAAALIVAGMSLSLKPSPRYSPFVRSVVFLGDISYALYCTHLLTFSLVAWTVTNLAISPLGHAWAYMAAMLTAGLVVGAATYLTFEKPTTNLLKKLIKRPRPPVKSAIAIHSTVPHPSSLPQRQRASTDAHAQI
jgi:exopolysaccharide production protein ExoZ